MRRLTLVVLWIGLLVASGVAGCRAEGDTPGFIVLPGMVSSLPYDSYDAHPITGKTLQRPPDGTVPHGFPVFSYGPGADEAQRAGAELENPLTVRGEAISESDKKRGRKAYDVFCGVCHGPRGDGDGPIIGKFPNPPSLRSDRAKGLSDGFLYHVIYHGQGLMPGYALQVDDADRWRIIAHIRTLQGS